MKRKRMSAKEERELFKSSAGERQRVFDLLCQHVRGGYSDSCFQLQSKASIVESFVKYPDEYEVVRYEEAVREGQAGWEEIGRKQSLGTCMGNSRSWYYNMSNRYGWREKTDITSESKGTVNVNVVSYASTKPLLSGCKQD